MPREDNPQSFKQLIAMRSAKKAAEKKKKAKTKSPATLANDVLESLKGGLAECKAGIDDKIVPDKGELAVLMPYATKIWSVLQRADGKDKKVWETKLAEGVGNSVGLNRKRSEKMEAYICRMLLQLVCSWLTTRGTLKTMQC